MVSDSARAMMMAIAMQESNLEHRSQLLGHNKTWWQLPKGPANGWWQFELNGVRAVMRHHAVELTVGRRLDLLQYPRDPKVVHKALQYDSQLAFVFARCLLWTIPFELPGEKEVDRAWDQYLSAWRPGKPHQGTWSANYNTAWSIVNGHEDVPH